MTNNTEWKEICKAYCNRIGAELLFVNDYDFGYELNGSFVHLDADGLREVLETWK